MTSCLGPWHSSTYPLGPTSRFLLFSPPSLDLLVHPPRLFASRVYTAREKERTTHPRGEVERYTRVLHGCTCANRGENGSRILVTSLWVNFLTYEEDWMKLKVIDGGYTYGTSNFLLVFRVGLLLDWTGYIYIYIYILMMNWCSNFLHFVASKKWELF